MKATDAILEIVRLGRGTRPASLENRETEEAINLSLALLTELCVQQDRIDRLERLLAERTSMPLEELRATDYPQGPAAAERAEALEALVLRVLRVRVDPRATGP
jgi:hypothetical protein